MRLSTRALHFLLVLTGSVAEHATSHDITTGLAIRQNTECDTCVNSDTTVLGAYPNGCGWKPALICASLLIGCGAVCLDAVAMEGMYVITAA